VKSPLSRVVSNRRLRVLAESMLHEWMAKLTASIGASPGVGAATFGDVRLRDGTYRQQEDDDDEADFLDTTDGTAPTWKHSGGEAPALTGEALSSDDGQLGRVQFVTLDKARDLLASVSRKAVNEFEASINRLRPGAPRSYRSFLMVMQSRKLMSGVVESALSTLGAALVKRPKRIGVQRISTRSSRVPTYGGFQFSGKFAFRQFQGRPLLPEAEWLRRYRARVKKAVKKKSKGQPSTPTKAPPTASPRPDTPAQIAARAAMDPKPNGRPPLSSKDWLSRYRARKKIWNDARPGGAKQKRVTKAPSSRYARPPHVLHLSGNLKRKSIYESAPVDLAEYFPAEDLNGDSILA